MNPKVPSVALKVIELPIVRSEMPPSSTDHRVPDGRVLSENVTL